MSYTCEAPPPRLYQLLSPSFGVNVNLQLALNQPVVQTLITHSYWWIVAQQNWPRFLTVNLKISQPESKRFALQREEERKRGREKDADCSWIWSRCFRCLKNHSTQVRQKNQDKTQRGRSISSHTVLILLLHCCVWCFRLFCFHSKCLAVFKSEVMNINTFSGLKLP